MNTDVVGPYDGGENSLPEGELKIADSKEPTNAPETSGEGVIFDFNFLHKS